MYQQARVPKHSSSTKPQQATSANPISSSSDAASSCQTMHQMHFTLEVTSSTTEIKFFSQSKTSTQSIAKSQEHFNMEYQQNEIITKYQMKNQTILFLTRFQRKEGCRN